MLRQDSNWRKFGKISLITALLSSFIIFGTLKSLSAEEEISSQKPWDELPSECQYSFNQSCRFYRLKAENGSRAALLVVDLNDHGFAITPFFSKKTETVSAAVKEQRALVGINGGFFNLSNGESTSYVVINGADQCDPKTNKALINNPELAPYLDTIFNRSEFRIMVNKDGNLKASITSHKDPIPTGWKLIHSLQAGPKLLPTVSDTEEAFVRKSADGKLIDSIAARKRAARTAIGITRDNHILLLAVADRKQDTFSLGVTLEELSKMMRDLGCNGALNCDGGTSTTFVLSEGDSRTQANCNLHKEISSDCEKLVKSGLLVQRNMTPNHSRFTGNYFSH